MLINLIENSLDACRMDSEKDDHRVTITARRSEPWMTIEVADNGIGMDEKTRKAMQKLQKERALRLSPAALETLAIEEMGGRTIASRQRMARADAPGEWTEIAVNSVEYEIDIRDSVFTLSNLRNPRD